MMKLAKIYTAVLVASALGVCSLPKQANAGSEIYDATLSNCTTVNCSSVIFDGVINRNNFGQAIPFILPVYFQTGECTRIDITSQTTDLEAVLVSPTGRVWRSDDRSANDLRPLIQAYSDVQGWYTLQIYHYSGTGPSGSSAFNLAYGRYNRGNSGNCPSQTMITNLTNSTDQSGKSSLETQ